MADIKKFLDQAGVSTLWAKIADKVNASVKSEQNRAILAEEANAAAAKQAQDEVDALELYVGTIPTTATATDIVGYIQEKTAGIATDAALGELTERVTTAEGAIDAIEADYLKAADKTELSNAIAAEKQRAEGIEGGLETRLATVEGDYLKAADKTELEGKINAKADQTALDAEVQRATQAEAGLQTQINTIMSNPDAEGAINSINEFTQYVKDHGEIAEGFRTDINKNKEDIAAMDAAYKAADTTIQGRLDVLEAIDHEAYKAADTALETKLNTEIAKKADAETVNGRLSAIETQLGDGEGSVSDQIADAKQEAIDAAGIAADGKVKVVQDALDAEISRAKLAEQANADSAAANASAIAAIKDDANIDSFADVVAALAGKQNNIPANTYDLYGSAAQALVDANAYTDAEVGKIQALSTTEIEQAIANAEAEAQA